MNASGFCAVALFGVRIAVAAAPTADANVTVVSVDGGVWAEVMVSPREEEVIFKPGTFEVSADSDFPAQFRAQAGGTFVFLDDASGVAMSSTGTARVEEFNSSLQGALIASYESYVTVFLQATKPVSYTVTLDDKGSGSPMSVDNVVFTFREVCACATKDLKSCCYENDGGSINGELPREGILPQKGICFSE